MFEVCLQKILDQQKILKPIKPDGTVVLREENVMKVEVSNVVSDAVVLNLRKIGSLSGIKDGPWKQTCDYAIVSRGSKKVRVVLVELKKTLNVEETKGFEQLRRTLPLLKYLRSMCTLECGPYPEQFEVRYALRTSCNEKKPSVRQAAN